MGAWCREGPAFLRSDSAAVGGRGAGSEEPRGSRKGRKGSGDPGPAAHSRRRRAITRGVPTCQAPQRSWAAVLGACGEGGWFPGASCRGRCRMALTKHRNVSLQTSVPRAA